MCDVLTPMNTRVSYYKKTFLIILSNKKLIAERLEKHNNQILSTIDIGG